MGSFIKKETGHNSWIARGEGFSGSITVDINGYDTVVVKPSYQAHLSQVGFGSNKKGYYFHLKDDDGTISMPAIFLCALRLCTFWNGGKPVWISDDETDFEGLPQEPDIAHELLSVANAHDNRQRWSEKPFKDWDALHEVATAWLTRGISCIGSQSLREAAALLEKIEDKTRHWISSGGGLFVVE
jgi:hypothetical protein